MGGHLVRDLLLFGLADLCFDSGSHDCKIVQELYHVLSTLWQQVLGRITKWCDDQRFTNLWSYSVHSFIPYNRTSKIVQFIDWSSTQVRHNYKFVSLDKKQSDHQHANLLIYKFLRFTNAIS